MARLELGFSPLTKTIQLAKMREIGPNLKQRVGNDRGRDVTNEAAQLVWQLVMAEGGRVVWTLDDGSQMILEAQKDDDVISCWNCEKTMTKKQHSRADGFCIHCKAEIELEEDGDHA
jgi:hypothetical protein